MALLLELIPIVAFFISYRWTNLYIATITMMAVSSLQIIISLIKKEKIPTVRWANTFVLMVLGSITFILKNEAFIKLKPTIGLFILATTLKFTAYRHGITLLEEDLGKAIQLSKKSWAQLNDTCSFFSYALGILNLIVAYTTTTDTWVYFKLFGFPGLTLLFIISQMAYLIYFKKITTL